MCLLLEILLHVEMQATIIAAYPIPVVCGASSALG